MDIPDVTAIAGLAFSGLIFMLVANRAKSHKLTVVGYTLADKTASKTQFGASLVAASTSLATVILFFINTNAYYGPVLFWCGFTYLFGQGLFLWHVTRKKYELKNIWTISDLWFTAVKSPKIARFITILTASSFLIILFVELYIGTKIITYYIPVSNVYFKVIAFVSISTIVISYVRIGGLRAVLQTDGWQFKLMFVASICILMVAMFAPSKQILTPESFWHVQASFGDSLSFCLWILCLNLTLPFTQLSSWQRLAATESNEKALKGFKVYSIPFLLIWFLPVIAFILLNHKGYTIDSLESLYDTMKGMGGAVSGILYPVIVVGFASALFSTADTALIALITSVSDKNTFRNRFEKLSERKLKRTITIIGLIIFALLAIVFGLAEANMGPWFIPLIYAIFGQLAIIAPLIMFSFHVWDKDEIYFSRLGDFLTMLGLAIGWFIVIGAVFVTQATKQQIWSQLAMVVGMIICGLFLAAALKFGKKEREEKYV